MLHTRLWASLVLRGNVLSYTCTSRAGQKHKSIENNRHFALFPSFFIEPVYRDEEQQQLKESGEFRKLTFLPVKPAGTLQNSSVFHDALVNKFTNHIMREGNKQLARELLEKTFEVIKRTQLAKYHKTTDPSEKEKIILNPWEILHKAVENGKPFLETTPVKRGGHTYQVPVPIRPNKQVALSIKWIIEAGKDKDDDMRFYKKLAYELIDAANGVGKVVKRKQDLHKLCEANRAYAHYRWG